MATREKPWLHGTPSWTDLNTSDPSAAQSFYAALFGWQIDAGDEQTGHYAMCSIGGRTVGGINGMPVEQPPAWAVYLASDDADATAEAVKRAGGTVVFGPMDVMDSGRMAVFQEPGGGMFRIWQAGTNGGFEAYSEPGADIWNEFMTRDVDGAKRFFGEVFGYIYDDLPPGMVGGPYSIVKVDGESVAGVGALAPGTSEHVPAHWRTYFAVEDADATAARITELGGSITRQPQDAPFGRFADAVDPQGAAFVIIKPPSGPSGDSAGGSEQAG